MKNYLFTLILPFLSCLFGLNLFAQKGSGGPDSAMLQSTVFREVGPFRGGRSCAVSGVAGKPNLFYFGATGGGIWKTEDGGRSWANISDGYFGGSVGAIDIAASDPNVLFVGMGEQTLRGNMSGGDGIWRSDDAGNTWKNVGLKNTRHVSRLRIHPKNPDFVVVAAIGDAFKATEERGIFVTKNGGKSWERKLFVSPEIGAADVCFDPTNPRILYASMWRYRRTPYSMSSGGAGCGLWKSTDGGETWADLTKNEGFPKDTLGIIGVAVAPNSNRVYAAVESKTGGIFRSDDGGKTWKRTNEDRSLRQRAWYYSRIYADPADPDQVYVMNVNYHRSKDGGKTFVSKNAPHGDHHDLWIDPTDTKRMIIGDDGGAQVTYDGGETWTTYHNQPTTQCYRVTTDNDFPYRIYIAQQDNSTVRIRHRTDGFSITEKDWDVSAGGESGHIAVDPLNNDIVYGGSYDGYLTRLDHKTNQERNVSIWPDNPMGAGAEAMKYRFQWNFPIFYSPHDARKLFACSNHLHSTINEGQSWQLNSSDLTRNDRTKLDASGGPITKDNTSVEYYATIFAAAESPIQKDLIWAGTDDGLIWITTDGGKNWANVTPKIWDKSIAGTDTISAKIWPMVNSLEPSPFEKGTCYAALAAYKSGDYRPLLFKTTDYGKTWEKITQGIQNDHFTRVVRCDPSRRGLLFCGTEAGLYASFDDGKMWRPFQLNLPIVPITDLTFKAENLIVATQGRSVWMMDDLSVLHQFSEDLRSKKLHLFKPASVFRMQNGSVKTSKLEGKNHPGGATFHFFLNEKPADTATVLITIFDSNNLKITEFSTKAKDEKLKLKDLKAGTNSFRWNMNYPDAKGFDGMILWNGDLAGPRAMPGTFYVRLTVNKLSEQQSFVIKKDPRTNAIESDFQKQFDYVESVNKKLTEMHEAIGNMRELKAQIKTFSEKLGDDEKGKMLRKQASNIDSTLTLIEKTLYQTQNRSEQDPLNFPIRLNDKLAGLNSDVRNSDFPPTDQAVVVRDELFNNINAQLSLFKKITENELPAFNHAIRSAEIDVIAPNKKKE